MMGLKDGAVEFKDGAAVGFTMTMLSSLSDFFSSRETHPNNNHLWSPLGHICDAAESQLEERKHVVDHPNPVY